MNFYQVADATYVSGWQRPYFGVDGKTWPERADSSANEFLKKKFAEIDEKIRTPLAFALLAPLGWSGEHCWEGFTPESMKAHGWEPLFWKESTHLDKTWVQLYKRELDRPPLEKALEFSKHNHSVSYSGTIPGNLPYLGCSSFFLSFDKPNEAIDFPIIKEFYRPDGYAHNGRSLSKHSDLDMKDVFCFVRVARPMKAGELAKLMDMGFEQLAITPFSRYLVRAKHGVGSEAKCEY